MSEMEKLADCPFCRAEAELRWSTAVKFFWVKCLGHICGAEGPIKNDRAEAITAWNTRQHATALEIGRGIGREEAAVRCEQYAAGLRRDAETISADGGIPEGQRPALVREMKYRASSVDIAVHYIRAASPALDVEALVERVSSVIDSTYLVDIGYHEIDNTEAIAHAVIASLGIKNG